MRPIARLNPTAWLTVIVLGLFTLATPTDAGDLPAVSDGQHLWLIKQAPAPEDEKDAEPRLTVYHLPTDTQTYLATKLDPILGELMPRGITAGDGRLLFIKNDRQLVTIRPIWSDLLRSWEYEQRTLTALPDGCTLLSLTLSERGPWALVKVQSRELLDQLDQVEVQTQKRGPSDRRMLNRALGLPEDLQWGDADRDEAVEQDTPSEDVLDDAIAPDDTDASTDEQAIAEPAAQSEEDAVEPTLPAYRLIHLRSSTWVRSPLPSDFAMPREARLLIRSGDDRPTILVDGDATFRRTPVLVRYNPVTPEEQADDAVEAPDAEVIPQAQAPAWERLATGMQLWSGRQWSANLVNGQIVVALEYNRSQEVVTIDSYHLRNRNTHAIGSTNISTGENARWSMFPWQDQIGLLVSPTPTPDPSVDQTNVQPSLAFLAGLSMNRQPMFQNEQGQSLQMPISEKQRTALEGNADLIVQILAFVTAMIMMVMFYRRAPQQDQLDLPDHLVLASFGRRAMAGVIDLAPGFILAGLIYDVTISEVLFDSWPGNGIEKAFVAMRPGFVVIGVTLLHTVICEFILARSLGKIMMSMYVSDLNGKPAPPLPCLGRSLSRAFELFAPLMILVAVISPARQRLGDILAKTTVVMRKPEPFIPPDDDDQ